MVLGLCMRGGGGICADQHAFWLLNMAPYDLSCIQLMNSFAAFANSNNFNTMMRIRLYFFVMLSLFSLQNMTNSGLPKTSPSAHLHRRMKVTPLIPKSLTKPKAKPPPKKTLRKASPVKHLPGDTYVYSEYDNEFVNLNSIVDKNKDQDTLDLLKELDNLDSDLELETPAKRALPKTGTDSVPSQDKENSASHATEKSDAKMAIRGPQTFKKYIPGPKCKKAVLEKKALVDQRDTSVGKIQTRPVTRKACPASKKRKLFDTDWLGKAPNRYRSLFLLVSIQNFVGISF